MANDLSIGALGRATGCKVQTIRYYEQIGLMPQATRTAGNQRIYGTSELERLKFIRHARELGFSVDAIRQLMSLYDNPDHSCESADAIARRQLDDVRGRIARLQALEGELLRMVEGCQGGRIAECHIFGVLKDHSLCKVATHDPV